MKTALPLLAAVLLATGVTSAQAESTNYLVGRAYVIDGDTLDMQGTRIRLWGMDAVESSQTCRIGDRRDGCGRAAANHLAEWIGQRTVVCVPTGAKTYDRLVARCQVGGQDIGQHQVDQGWAFDAPKFSGGFYKQAEASARSARVGVHAYDEVQSPLEYRRSK